MRMIAATTGLSALRLLNNFLIFCSIPPLGVHVESKGTNTFKSYVFRH
jgi:hypothetical protein